MTTEKNKGKERRRFKRYGINLGAILVFDDSITLQCNILDFCRQGLFLEIKQSSPDLFPFLHKKGQVLFFVTSDQGREYVQVDVTVMRVCSNGVGVSFEKISDAVFQGLTQKAKSQAISESAVNIRSNRERLKTAVAELVKDRLPLLMGHFFNRVFDDLEQAAAKAEGLRAGELFLDASRELALLQETIINEINHTVLNKTDFSAKSDAASFSSNDNGQTLSLVDINDFEDWLNVSASVKKVESHYSERLHQMELKLSYITGIQRTELVNPLCPANLYDAFRAAIGKMEKVAKIKQTLYKVFEAALIEHLSLVYQPFEKILQESGAPSRISEDIVPHAFEPPKRDHAPDDACPDLQKNEETGDSFPSATPTRRHAPRTSEETGAAFSLTERTKQGQPVAETATKLLNIINKRHEPGRKGSADNDDAAQAIADEYAAYSSDEIVTAISHLQTKETASSVIHQDYAALQKHLSETLEASTDGAKQFSSIDKNRIEVYGQLFDSLMNDLMYTPHIKSYLEAIHLPLMALALKDPEFLDSETHPARSVLNQLSALEGAVKGNRIVRNHKIRDTLDELFARIAQEAMDDPGVFARVDDELKNLSRPFIKSTETSIRRIIEAYEGKQKLEEARRLIAELEGQDVAE
ncbi:MAG: DUF1631 family protein, partial [Gammaproteobacteria bacterium]